MNNENVIMALVTTLFPGADMSMQLKNSSERYIIIETKLIRCSISQSNKGTPIDPAWKEPNIRYTMQYGIDGYTVEQSKLIVEQFIKFNTIFGIFALSAL